MIKEEQMRTEATRAWTELDSLIMRMKVEESSALRELEELNRKLPAVLVEWAKGTAARDKVKAIKTRIADLRELVGDIPLILRELENEKRLRCFQPLQDACALSKHREKYNDLKEMISDRYEPALVEELRRYALHIGEEDDCEEFLSCLATSTVKGQ